jgi:hypothetical protein
VSRGLLRLWATFRKSKYGGSNGAAGSNGLENMGRRARGVRNVAASDRKLFRAPCNDRFGLRRILATKRFHQEQVKQESVGLSVHHQCRPRSHERPAGPLGRRHQRPRRPPQSKSPVEALRQIKVAGGPLTKDAQRYLHIHQTYNGTVTAPFNSSMGEIQATCFWNTYPRFQDTNNLSLTVFIQYSNFKILFPGDLERDGWDALLEQPYFVRMLAGTDVLVASHHGRENGFNPRIFNYFTPSAVVVSDKPICHDTQRMVPDYRAVVRDRGVRVATTMKDRHVLTTRRDGSITFFVDETTYRIETEHKG